MRSANDTIEDLDSQSPLGVPLLRVATMRRCTTATWREQPLCPEHPSNKLKQARSSELNVSRLIEEVIMQTRAHYRQLPEGNPFDVGTARRAVHLPPEV